MRIHFPGLDYGALQLGLLLAAAISSRAAVNLTVTDAPGTTSFNAAGNWSQAQAPHAGTNYLVAVPYLRTPQDGSSYTFLGDSLTITNGGGLIYKGTAAANTYTFNPLILHNGGVVRSGAGSGNTMILAGTISILGTNVASQILADQSPFTINAAISGAGNLLFAGGFTTTVNGTNTMTGNLTVSGVLVQGPGSVLTFKIGGAGTNNSVSGSGTATFNGRFNFDLSTAGTNLGAAWMVVSPATKTFGSTFSVDGFTKQGFGTGPGVWSLATNGVYYEFNTTSGGLSVVAAPGAGTAASLAPTSVKFEAVEADLLAAYDQTYASGVGGEDNAQVIIANAVAGQNHINDHSGTGARMRIVGYYQGATYNYQSSTLGGYVGWLANNNARVADVVSAGAALGADLVVYICEPVVGETAAGVAQQPGMYSSLAPSAVWSAVFAHETGGHNYGRSHSDGFAVPDGNGNLGFPKTVMLHNYCSGGSSPPYFFSNPKIWYSGRQLQGDGNNCGQGGVINGGDNSLPSADSAVSVADRRTRIIVGPNLNNVFRRWLFTNAPAAAPAGTTNFDLIAGAPAIVRGGGAIYTGHALRLPGGTAGNVAMDAMSAYLDLPNGLISAQTNLTIELWATPLSAPNWARLLDFGRTTEAGNGAPGEWTGQPGTAAPGTTSSSDDIVLTVARGTVITAQRFEAKLNGAATSLDSDLVTTAGVPHHYAITFTDGAGVYQTNGGRWEWYRDGDAIAYLDVSNHLAQIEDVNNWLGRSQWSSDANANSDYTEVRLSNVALSRGEVVANYLLGPNYQPTTTVALNGSDAFGTSSFNAAGQWSSAVPPAAANSYETFAFWLRTPATASSYTFGGNTLKLSGGTLLYKSSGSSTITVTNLQLNGGVVAHSGSGTLTLAGNIDVSTNGAQFNAQNGPVTVSAPLNGLAPVSFIGGNSVTLAGNNSNFSGRALIGNGWFGSVTIDSPARLGPPPSAFTGDHLAFNRGTLVTTATMTLSNDNRGILFDVSGGTFNVASGTTLTVASTLSSPATDSASIIVGGLTKTGPGTLVLSSTNSTFKGGVWLDSGSTTANDGVVRLVNNQALANARSPFFFRNNSGAAAGATLQLDGAAGNLSLSQGLSLFGRNSTIPALQNLAGTNTLAGGITITVGGANYRIQSDAGQLNLGGTLTATATGARTFTFLGSGHHLVTGVITDGSATVNVAKTGTGTLTLAGANTFTGTATVNGGTLLVNGSVNASSVSVGDVSTLGGNGTITGAVNLNSGGTLAPGSGIGRLTVSNSLVAANGSVTRMEISKTGSVTTNDAITGLTSISYGGSLTVTNLGPGALAAGDTFPLFSAGAYAGTFTATNLPTLPAGLAWNFDGGSGVLSVVNPVATNPTNLAFSLGGGNLTLAWPSDHTGWRLQTQTNPLATGLTTNWFDVAGATTTNQMLLPVAPDAPSIFFRLTYP